MSDSSPFASYLFEKGCDMSGLSIKPESEGYSSFGEFLSDFLSIFLAPVGVAGCCAAIAVIAALKLSFGFLGLLFGHPTMFKQGLEATVSLVPLLLLLAFIPLIRLYNISCNLNVPDEKKSHGKGCSV